jgi:tripartite-type tricarboxylate transporter receptor subunit TctC
MKRVLFMAIAAIVAAVVAAPASAQFYKGTPLTVIINYSAGGPTDIEGRLTMRHLAKHIEGQPEIVVKNVAGAGGMVGQNFLGERVKNDGYTMGFFTFSPVIQMVGDSAMRVRYDQFVFLFGLQQTQLTYARTDIKPGLKKPSDIAKASGFKFGGLRPSSSMDLRCRMALDLLGMPYGYVTGFKGTVDSMSALLRNEVQTTFTSAPMYYARVVPTMVKTGQAIPLWQFAVPQPDGTYVKNSDMKEFPSFVELYKSIHGKMPSGKRWETLKLLNGITGAMVRVVLLPPKAPKEAQTAIRAAFAKMQKDANYLADAKKTMKNLPEFVSGPEGERIIADLKNANPELVAFMKTYLKK